MLFHHVPNLKHREILIKGIALLKFFVLFLFQKWRKVLILPSKNSQPNRLLA